MWFNYIILQLIWIEHLIKLRLVRACVCILYVDLAFCAGLIACFMFNWKVLKFGHLRDPIFGQQSKKKTTKYASACVRAFKNDFTTEFCIVCVCST